MKKDKDRHKVPMKVLFFECPESMHLVWIWDQQLWLSDNNWKNMEAQRLLYKEELDQVLGYWLLLLRWWLCEVVEVERDKWTKKRREKIKVELKQSERENE